MKIPWKARMFSRRRWMLAAVLAAVVVVVALSTNFLTWTPGGREPSPEFLSKNKSGMDKNPPGLVFSISTDKAVHHIGEPILVRLRFENKSEKRFSVTTRTYDRSGRMDDVEFFVDGPAGGFADPLASGRLMRCGGGLGGSENLGVAERTFTLNEYVRFDKPGVYHVFCRSILATDEESMKSVAQTSPVITLKIAEPRRLNALFREMSARFRARACLGTARKEAVRELRWMASRGASDELANLFGADESQVEAALGLEGARDRAHALESMIRGLSNPEARVNGFYMSVLCHISFPEEHYFAMADFSLMRFFLWDEHNREADRLRREYLGILAKSLGKRDGRNLADACMLLMWDGARNPPCGVAVREGLARTFQFLTTEERTFVLSDQWESARCAMFEKVLAELAAAGGKDARLAALRLADLRGEKDEARRMTLADMSRKDKWYPLSVLTSLEDAELPELDGVFLEGAFDNTPHAAALLARYGTGRFFGEALDYFARLEDWKEYCSSPTNILRYLLKHDRRRAIGKLEGMTPESSLWDCGGFYEVFRDFYGDDVEGLALKLLARGRDHKSFGLLLLLADMGGDKCAGQVLGKMIALKKSYREKHGVVGNNAMLAHKILKRGKWRLDDALRGMLLESMETDEDRRELEARLAATAR